ncbi:MAG: helix-turn-helix transcriptional regulator [Nitrospirae bacterium]|nr:helix-turn-helix transcriptional regulator [Nitrospirota bacterium]
MTIRKRNPLGKRLKKARNLAGYSQKQIGDMLGIKQQRYQLWETGINEPSLEFIKKLSEVLEVKMSELLGEEEEKYTDLEKKAMIVAKKLFKYLKNNPEEFDKMKKIITSLTINKKDK